MRATLTGLLPPLPLATTDASPKSLVTPSRPVRNRAPPECEAGLTVTDFGSLRVCYFTILLDSISEPVSDRDLKSGDLLSLPSHKRLSCRAGPPEDGVSVARMRWKPVAIFQSNRMLNIHST